MVLEMLEVLVVLKELVVFVRGKFETVKSPNFFWGKIIESKKKIFGAKRNLKILKTKSKIHLYFRVAHSIIPLWSIKMRSSIWFGSASVDMGAAYVNNCHG